MKKLFYLFVSSLLFTAVSCSEDVEKSSLRTWTENLMEKYPNFRSNDIASQALNDSIHNYCEAFMGKEATLFDGMTFKFTDMLENEGDSINVIFRGRESASIESDAEGAKYIMETMCVNVLGCVPKDVAATLSEGAEYKVTGKIVEIDFDEILFKAKATTFPDDLYFGTYRLQDMKITKIEDK